MAQWDPTASAELAKSIIASKISRAEADQLEQDIDNWANGIAAADRTDFPSPNGQGTFTAHAENQTVRSVGYSW